MKRLFLVLAVLVVLGIMTAVIGILVSSRAPVGAGPRVLTYTLDQPLVDYSPFPRVPFLETRAPDSLVSLYRAMQRASGDDSVRGLALTIKNARFGLAKGQEFHSMLSEFSSTGRFVDCYLETAGEGTNGTLAYFVASACDRISMAPAADFNVVGLFADSTFLRGTLDKLKIEPQFSHVGDFKSAAETYTETQHSARAREALEAVLDDWYGMIVRAVALGRGLEESRVRELVDEAPMTPESALRAGLVDDLLFPDQFEAQIRDRQDKGLTLTPLLEYGTGGGWGADRIAIVFVQGTIVRGRGGVDPWSQQQFAGSDAYGEILRDLAENDSVAAVVLRIDSPGGSPLASDLILREIELLAERKPVVVSMSDLAASGGYYIASGATRIVSSPATLTGSIGVVGGKLATGRFQAEVLGMTHDGIKRGDNADYFSNSSPFSPAQMERFQEQMESVYDRFVEHVARGRDMGTEEVLEVAGGRVWTGRQASENGLVDELGGLGTALEVARELAGLDPTVDDLDLLLLPRSQTLFEFLSGSISSAAGVGPLHLLEKLTAPPGHQLELSPETAALTRSF